MKDKKNQKAKGEQPKVSEFKPKAGPKSGGVKGKTKKAQAKKNTAIDFKEERRIWAQAKANQAKSNVQKTLNSFPENMYWIIISIMETVFGDVYTHWMDGFEYGGDSAKKVNDHEVKRAVFNAIRKALVEEGYFSWDKDDKSYIKFQQEFNALWRELNDLWYNANKAYGHQYS